MGTRSHVCYYEKGTDDFVCTYVQFDGYLEGVGKALAENFRDEDSARSLAYLGEIRSIQDDGYQPVKPWLEIAGRGVDLGDEREAPIRVAAASLAQHISKHSWIPYFYLFIESKWICVTSDSVWVLGEDWERVLSIKNPKKLTFTMLGENREHLSIELVQ